MAAYASLLSLGHTLDQLLQHPPRQMAVLDKAQIDSLLENLTFLRDFLEDFSLISGDEIQALEEKISRSAYAAEDIIESRVVDLILEHSEAGRQRSSTLFSRHLGEVIEEICFLDKDVMKIKETEGIKIMEQPRKATTAGSFLRGAASDSKNTMVGFHEDLNQIMETLTGDELNLQIIPILEDSEAGSERGCSTLFCQDLQKVIEEFSSMKKDVMKIEIVQQPTKVATAGSFVRVASNSKNAMVGFDKDLVNIMDTFTGDESNLQILSIVGMGGIGKTTLAKNVFDHPLIEQHFDLRAWVTISQQYNVHEILSGLLKEIGGEEITQKNDDELGLRLYRSLFDRRYFIVMDDMWSIEVWDAIKRFFPDNNNGSRVLVTTRLSNVADNFFSCTPHQLHLLDKDQSWALFCDKVFGQESCPCELEKVGKTIVRNCGGLPLAIVAISGLLAKSSRTVEYWEHVANDTHEALNKGGDGLCFEILSLSYKHLPVHLKPCFLYMAIFPEDHKIKISKLVKLWVAEGILKPMSSRSLEEIAEDNLKDLIDRNLIQVHAYGSRNKIKTCTIHDLLRDLCLREAQKEKFFRVTMMDGLDNHSKIIDNNRRLIIQRSSDKKLFRQQVFDAMKSASCTRSLICWKSNLCRQQVFDAMKSAFHAIESTSIKLAVCFRLLSVLNVDYSYSCEEILQLVNLRYIYFHASSNPNLLNPLESLSLLWNLQTIIIAGTSCDFVKPTNLPAEIWEMPQLRHLKMEEGNFYLPDPPSTNSKNGRRDILVMKNLQTLYKIRNFRCTDEVVHRMPNLKKLGITYKRFPSGFGWDHYEVYNLSNFHNLESLIFGSYENVLRNLCFPQSLKKLTLQNCRMPWEDLTVVGSLPHLEVLNLFADAVRGCEWNPVEGEFLELKSLTIISTDLVEWTADSSHFPRLEELTLTSLKFLKEIPDGIGEIQTLRSIILIICSDSAKSSAEKIQEEQLELGNHDLQVRIVG